MKDFANMLDRPTGELRELLSLANALADKMMQNSFANSFSAQLELTANVLRANGMPQATINMALAARCGVPLEPIDCKSMYVQWTENEPKVEQ